MTDEKTNDGLSTDDDLRDDAQHAEVIESTVVFDGAVWDIRRDEVVYGDGTMVREYMAHTGAVAIYAEDDDGRVLVIQQYRHPVRLRDWELPAGLLDIDEELPLEAAKRELAEEADLQAESWEPLVTYNSSPGGSDEVLHVFRARGVSPTGSAFEREQEEADIVTRWVPRGELVAAILDGRLSNAALIVATLAVDAAERRAS